MTERHKQCLEALKILEKSKYDYKEFSDSRTYLCWRVRNIGKAAEIKGFRHI